MTFLPSGRGDGIPRVEVARINEMAAGIAAPEPVSAPMPRPPYAKGSAEAREAGSRGGKTKAGSTRLASRLSPGKLPVAQSFRSYKASATSWRRAHCASLAASVGGGFCGPGPSSLVASAALQLAWSRYLFDIAAAIGARRNEAAIDLFGGDAEEIVARASRLANDSRQSLLAAHELAAREAEARRSAPPARSNELPAWLCAAEEGADDAEG